MNTPNRETQLWYWLLFSGVMPTTRAKTLLDAWRINGSTLEAALAALPGSALAAGFTAEEARAAHPPTTLETITALRWDETLYPKGLLQLELKHRPALLFYRGEPRLLYARPLLVIPPAPLDDVHTLLLQEMLSCLLGENLLPAAVRGSVQAECLLSELADAEGDLLLFARHGLESVALSAGEQYLLESERLLLLSPLLPNVAANAKWDAALLQVELAAADHVLWISATPPAAPINGARTLWITAEPPNTPPLPGLRCTAEASDVLQWLLESAPATPTPSAAAASVEAPPLPPLPPSEALRILERGGAIPEALRRRLLGQ